MVIYGVDCPAETPFQSFMALCDTSDMLTQRFEGDHAHAVHQLTAGMIGKLFQSAGELIRPPDGHQLPWLLAKAVYNHILLCATA